MILLGVFDWDLHPSLDGAEYSSYLPMLYYVGQQRQLFNTRKFLLSQLQGLIHAAVIFFVTFIAFQDSAVLSASNGFATDLWTSSVTAFTALVFTVNMSLVIRMKYLTVLHAIAFAIVSIGFYYAFMWFTNFVDFGWTQYSVDQAHQSALFYLCLLITICLCFALDLVYESYLVLIMTSPASLLRLIISQGKSISAPAMRRRFEEISERTQQYFRQKSSHLRQV